MASCKIDNCTRDVRCRGLCAYHYKKMLKSGELKKINKERPRAVDGCQSTTKKGALGLCKAHYLREYDNKRKDTKKRKNQKIKSQLKYQQTIKAAYKRLLYTAKKKNKDCTITIEQLETLRKIPCVKCGNIVEGTGLGLELINKKDIFSLDNVRSMCGPCRLSKPAQDFNYLTFSKGILRRYWKKTPMASIVKQKARRSYGKYECNLCHNIFSITKTEIDHIEPIHPIDGSEITLDEFAKRLYCSVEKLQLICKECHIDKTKKENKIRTQNRKVSNERNE